MSLGDADLNRIRRRSLVVLSAGQVLGGLANGAALSLGALLVADVSGSDALSGMATTMVTLGAALSAIPLAWIAVRLGRRGALSIGAVIAVAGCVLTVTAVSAGNLFGLLFAMLLIGTGSAVNLQSRFAASDLASDATRARDLSVVVWATTIGAVAGPNLLEPGEWIGRLLHLPTLTGPFVFSVVGMAAAAVLYVTALRPDPLLLSTQLELGRPNRRAASAHPSKRLRTFAIVAVALSHAVMVSVMAMTPVHLREHGISLGFIGVTLSLHVAGMYGLSPVFGLLADRLGRVGVILMGQALYVAALVTAWIGADDHVAVSVALALLGLGWSASTVAGSALLTESTAPHARARLQGISDTAMNFSGAIGGVLAGGVLTLAGYGGLALSAGVLVVAVVVAAAIARRPEHVL